MDRQEALRRYFGHDSFRPGQETLIDALLQGRDALGIMPTGAGKSMCYQIPALLLPGITVVISPLISLMKDQVAALIAAGIPAAYLNSSLTPRQLELATERAARGAYRIIYAAPERLETASFRHFAARANISLIAVDEAHCVSQWGQDFRPHYLRIADFIDSLPHRPPVGAFTATATDRVRSDIVRLLRLRSPESVTTGFDRPNLYFEVVRPARRDAALLEILRRQQGRSGIVYCATRRNVEGVAEKLQRAGFAAARYHAGLEEAERKQAQEDFSYDRVQVMVATNAFGMGIDKSNVGFVIHYNMPKSMEAYYQEAGRAGRDGADAECILLYSRQDIITGKFLITHAEPNPDLTPEEQRRKQREDLRRLQDMAAWCESGSCLRGGILRYFGQEAGENCGSCGNCTAARYAYAGVKTAPSKKKGAPSPEPPPAPGPAAPPSMREGWQQQIRAQQRTQELFDALRACRMRISKELHVPPYIIFDDKTLHDMAQKKPASPEALLRVRGVGEVKAARYGERFLAAIAQWQGGDSVPHTGAPDPAKPANARPPVEAPQRARPIQPAAPAIPVPPPVQAIPVPPPAPKPAAEAPSPAVSAPSRNWTAEEDAALRQAYLQGVPSARLAERFGCGVRLVRERLRELGLMI